LHWKLAPSFMQKTLRVILSQHTVLLTMTSSSRRWGRRPARYAGEDVDSPPSSYEPPNTNSNALSDFVTDASPPQTTQPRGLGGLFRRTASRDRRQEEEDATHVDTASSTVEGSSVISRTPSRLFYSDHDDSDDSYTSRVSKARSEADEVDDEDERVQQEPLTIYALSKLLGNSLTPTMLLPTRKHCGSNTPFEQSNIPIKSF
jgi:hypothetical protein